VGGGADGDTWWPSRRALLTCTRRKRRRWSRWCVASDIYGFLPCVWITNLSFSTFRFLRHVTRRPILRPLLPPLLFPPSIPLTACPDTHPHTPPPATSCPSQSKSVFSHLSNWSKPYPRPILLLPVLATTHRLPTRCAPQLSVVDHDLKRVCPELQAQQKRCVARTFRLQ